MLAYRQPERFIQPFLFFILMTVLFPLAVGPDKKALQQLAPGIMWLSVLLANLLAFDNLFREDFHDGCLEQFVLHAKPLPVFVFAKIFAHWLTTCIPLIFITPVMTFSYGLPSHAVLWLIVSLLVGTPIVVFVGGLVSAVIIGLRQSGVLLALLLLPLLIPVLIFGAGVVNAAEQGGAVSGQIAILSAVLLLCVAFLPPVIAGALKEGIND